MDIAVKLAFHFSKNCDVIALVTPDKGHEIIDFNSLSTTHSIKEITNKNSLDTLVP